MLRKFIIRLLNPFVWRGAVRSARKYAAFSAAEQSSMLDLQLAARHTTDSRRAALYLRHAGDERRHTRLFRGRAKKLLLEAHLAAPVVRVDHESLFERLGEIKFVAFVHRGEVRGQAQFASYARYFEKTGRQEDAALLKEIAKDEAGHAAYTHKLLLELAGEAGARKALRAVARWEAWRGYRRLGRGAANFVYHLLMGIVYLLCAPLALVLRWLRAGQKGWIISGKRG